MSRHVLTPKPAYADHQIVVGWDPPLGSYYAQVINHDAEPNEPGIRATAAAFLRKLAAQLRLPTRWHPDEPVFIWLGADRIPITDPDDVIRAVAPYAHVPDGLELELSTDEINEGNRRRFRP